MSYFAIFIIGPAGSGKSTFTSTFSEYLYSTGIDNIIVNLDPAVNKLPYNPTIDIREYINASEIERKFNLGPNGAIIAATDMSAIYLKDILKRIKKSTSGFVLVDTPGQMELFTFRPLGKEVISYLSSDRAVILFTFDALTINSSSSFVSLLLLSLATHYRYLKPQILLLNKLDIAEREQIEKITQWISEPLSLITSLRNEKGILSNISELIVEAIKDFINIFNIFPISAKKSQGYDNVYAELERLLAGGEIK